MGDLCPFEGTTSGSWFRVAMVTASPLVVWPTVRSLALSRRTDNKGGAARGCAFSGTSPSRGTDIFCLLPVALCGCASRSGRDCGDCSNGGKPSTSSTASASVRLSRLSGENAERCDGDEESSAGRQRREEIERERGQERQREREREREREILRNCNVCIPCTYM